MTTIRYVGTPDDIGAFMQYAAARPEQRRRAWRTILPMVLACPFLVLAVGWALGGFAPMRFSTRTLIVACAPSMLMLAVLAFRGPLERAGARANQRVQTEGSTRGVRDGQIVLEVLAEGVQVTAPLARSLYDWRAISGTAETPAHLFILLGPMMGIPVPKRDLDAGALDALRAALAAGLARRDQPA